MAREHVVVLFSGGQDSTTCLAQAVRELGPQQVACITFHYGQRHAQEVDVARAIAADFGVSEHPVFNLDDYRRLTSSALLDPAMAFEQTPGDACPNTVVDGRNMLFLLLAAVYAKSRQIRTLVTGVCETDSSGYPDCRDVFVKSCNVTLNLAMSYEFRILTPLMDLTKAQIWALADRLDVLDYIEKKTLTCYRGIVGRGCGTCPSCHLRNQGLETYRKHQVTPC